MLSGMILDSGAGTGNLTIRLLDEGHDVLAADNNRQGLSALRDKCREYKGLVVKNIDLSKSLPIADETFDGITSSFVIPFVSNVDRYISENYRVLRFGGIMSLSALLPVHGLMEYVMSNDELESRAAGLLPRYQNAWEELWKTARANERIILGKKLTEYRLIKMLSCSGFKVEVSPDRIYGQYVSLLKCTK